MKRFQTRHPEQPHLPPPDPREWPPEAHPAFTVHDLAARLDLREMLDGYGDGRTGGVPPFDPRMTTRVWLYAILHGVGPCELDAARRHRRHRADRLLDLRGVRP